ncbi:MAG: glutathione synthase [Saprospiraceae bacterium]|mgnify:CR=1 FL=1
MKKIGILFGMENTFPQAFIDRVNSKNIEGIVAEAVTVDMVLQGEPTEYAVIIDRISQDVPFYRAYLKNAAAAGTAVINNPFWWSADEKFFNNTLALKVGVPVPKTVLLPSKERPDDTSDSSFRNLKFPLSWDQIFDHIGFPAFMKPHSGGGWKSVYKLENKEEFFKAYAETNQLVMMLQEAIDFTDYYRCYCIGGKHVHIMPYEPRNPHHLRYVLDAKVDPEKEALLTDYVLRLCEGLGYDFNTVELAVRDGIPYAIDFGNPAPDAELTSVGPENFEWVVENAANYAIERAQAQEFGKDNLTWGTFMQNAVGAKMPTPVAAPAKKASTKKAAAKKVVKKNEKVTSKTVTPAPNTDKAAAMASLLSNIGEATAESKEDLKKIKGVGPKLEQTLNSIGIFTYGQVSKMTEKEYDLVDNIIDSFKGRGKRDNWASQAKGLM